MSSDCCTCGPVTKLDRQLDQQSFKVDCGLLSHLHADHAVWRSCFVQSLDHDLLPGILHRHVVLATMPATGGLCLKPQVEADIAFAILGPPNPPDTFSSGATRRTPVPARCKTASHNHAKQHIPETSGHKHLGPRSCHLSYGYVVL